MANRRFTYCKNVPYTVEDELGNPIETGEIKSGETKSITAQDGELSLNGGNSVLLPSNTSYNLVIQDSFGNPLHLDISADTITVEPEWALFSINAPAGTTQNLRLDNSNGEQWLIDDGENPVQFVNSGAFHSWSYTNDYDGVVRVRPVSGDLSLVERFESIQGYWDFNILALAYFPSLEITTFIGSQMALTGDISVLSNVTYQAYFDGNQMALTGDISSLSNVTFQTYFNSSQMTLFGDISSLSNVTNVVLFSGNQMALTGDISVLSNVTSRIQFNGTNISLSYTSTSWARVVRSIYLNLSTNRLQTSTEVDNLINDNANAPLPPVNSGGTHSLAFNNAPRTSASDAGVATLNGYGITVITN